MIAPWLAVRMIERMPRGASAQQWADLLILIMGSRDGARALFFDAMRHLKRSTKGELVMAGETQKVEQEQVPGLPLELGEIPADPKRLPKLAAALAKAQAEIENAEKNSTAELVFKDKEGNPKAREKVRYADLASVFNAVRGPLSKHELAIAQFVVNDMNGTTVTTRLMHSSGEYLENVIWLPVALKTPQGYGSAITYARRYGLQTLVGLAAEEDDDAHGAGVPSLAQQTPGMTGAQRAAQRVKEHQQKQPPPAAKKERPKTGTEVVEQQRADLLADTVGEEPEQPPPATPPPPKQDEVPRLLFGPEALKGKPIAELEGPQLLELIAYGTKRLADPAAANAKWRPQVEWCVKALEAERVKRDEALKAGSEPPEPGADAEPPAP